MTQEETNKRNEAIWLMTGGKIEEGRYYDKGFSLAQLHYHRNWDWLMPAYEHIIKLDYHGTIEDLGIPGHRVYFTDKNFKEVGTGNRDEDLRTAIWLTVSDFAIEFNNLSDKK